MPDTIVLLAAEVKVNTEEKLRNAIETAAAGDVINVTANITLTDDPLRIKHQRPLAITSNNHSTISIEPGFLYVLWLYNGAKVTLKGNIRVDGGAQLVEVFVQNATLTFTEQAVVKARQPLSGCIGVSDGGELLMTGGSLIKETNGKGITTLNSAKLSITGGSITVSTPDSSALGIELRKSSSLSIQGGSIDVNGETSCAILTADSQCIIGGSKISARGSDEAVGLHLMKNSKMSVHNSRITATSTKGESWGVKASENCMLSIFDFMGAETRISGQKTGVSLGKGNQVSISTSPNLSITGGLHEEAEKEKLTAILSKLPSTINLLAGRKARLELEGVQAPIRFRIDSETSRDLHAIPLVGGDNLFSMQCYEEGQYPLILTGTSDVQENTVTLRFMVNVTAIPFSDVTGKDWYCDYIMNLYNSKIIKGYPDASFRTDNKLLREHAAKMITLGAGLKYEGKKANFPDVDPDGEMSPYIAALVEQGAIRGYPDGTFRPRRNITRAEIAQIVVKAFNLEMGTLPSSFPDLPSGEAGDYIKILASNGIVKGYPDGKFKPQGLVSRAEFCKILTVAMAVYGVQQAEFAARYSVSGRDLLTRSIAAAQALIDVLPDDQDLQTKAYLQARLDALK